ncbi:type II toxin-antitoxin system RelE/ParE family toxin [Fusobacterium massiliense]|jgi:toxin-antitoxin system, toxin component, relE family|uniref:type II toxin-antitoxin system RelE family toxin n=1 Tax=Fusobacterium massiliense TaxID=1852365 RepID=UPI0028D00653|nr:type II toxin-antitoxin system RelE/ParE family toxin [Fusobacterium massiliense]
MGYRIMIPDKVNKKILGFDKNTRKLLYDYISKNLKDTDNPRLHGKALTGYLKGLWRYRIMDYRLIVDIQDKQLIIVAVDFEHRSKIYL